MTYFKWQTWLCPQNRKINKHLQKRVQSEEDANLPLCLVNLTSWPFMFHISEPIQIELFQTNISILNKHFLCFEGSIKSTAPPFWSSPPNQMTIIQKIGASQNYRDLHQSLSPGQHKHLHKAWVYTKILCTEQQLNLCSLLLCCWWVLHINFLHTRLSPFGLQQTPSH